MAPKGNQLLDDKRTLPVDSGKERFKKILDQSSQDILDYLGDYGSSSIEPMAGAPPAAKRERSLDPSM